MGRLLSDAEYNPAIVFLPHGLVQRMANFKRQETPLSPAPADIFHRHSLRIHLLLLYNTLHG